MKKVRNHIPSWVERCNIHGGIVSDGMIQARMQQEIDDLRIALEDARSRVDRVNKIVEGNCYRNFPPIA